MLVLHYGFSVLLYRCIHLLGALESTIYIFYIFRPVKITTENTKQKQNERISGHDPLPTSDTPFSVPRLSKRRFVL